MTKREFLAGGMATGIGLNNASAALAQQANAAAKSGAKRPPTRIAKTTKLFKCPSGFPNGVAATSEGLWIAEQKLSGTQAASYHLPEPASLIENAWLVDWNGKVLKTVATPSRNTSGMAVGGGYVWMIANSSVEGVFQVDMNSKLISHRQIPLGPANDGGGCHGAIATSRWTLRHPGCLRAVGRHLLHGAARSTAALVAACNKFVRRHAGHAGPDHLCLCR